jgi:hypothetical protein
MPLSFSTDGTLSSSSSPSSAAGTDSEYLGRCSSSLVSTCPVSDWNEYSLCTYG